MKSFFLTLFCFISIIVKCQNSKKEFVLNGIIQNRDTGKIFLRYINDFDKWVSDTAILINGHFRFVGEINEPVYASISGYKKIVDFEQVNFTNIFLEPGIQKINLTENDFVHSKMEGSLSQREYDTLTMNVDFIKLKYKNIHQEILVSQYKYKEAKSQIEKDIALELQNEFIAKLKPENDEISNLYISFAKEHPNSYVSPNFFYFPAKLMPIDSAKLIFSKFSPSVQKSRFGKDVANLFVQQEQNAIGKVPYNFNAIDINGINISLSSFKDKYLYIDFWASWCSPCRAEIPHLKNIFELYNPKGLEILTISIDKDSIAWKNAVKTEQLSKWHNVLVNKEIEKNYDNIKNPIPSGILIAKDGKVLWKSSNDESLESVLKRIVN
jgi:thiol-disulfide isomerase/thioredoxin